MVLLEVGGPQPSSEGSADTISDSDTGAMIAQRESIVAVAIDSAT
jgi:hypothetical protein